MLTPRCGVSPTPALRASSKHKSGSKLPHSKRFGPATFCERSRGERKGSCPWRGGQIGRIFRPATGPSPNRVGEGQQHGSIVVPADRGLLPWPQLTTLAYDIRLVKRQEVCFSAWVFVPFPSAEGGPRPAFSTTGAPCRPVQGGAEAVRGCLHGEGIGWANLSR